MDYDTTDREPTMTDIKNRIAQLNKDIKTYAKNKITANQWNIPNMIAPALLKKYNSTDYSNGPQGVVNIVRDNWWGTPGAGGWGENYFPNDKKAWWISNKNYMLMGNMGYFYYVYNSLVAKYIGVYTVGDNEVIIKVNGQNIASSGGGNFGANLVAGKNVFEVQLINSGGPGAFVFYAYEIGNNNNVYFRSGDAGWGYSMTPVPDYTMISNEKELSSQSRMNFATVYGNNGSVSCTKYCHGSGGRQWGGGLPADWKGAQCASAGKNGNIPCSKAMRDPAHPNGILQCVCQRNDDFPYETRNNAWTFPDVPQPTTVADNSDVNQMRLSIDSQIRNIQTLLKNVAPKMKDNISKKEELIEPLLTKLAEAQTTYAALVEEAKIPDYYRASQEAASVKATAGFNKYVWYLIFTVLFLIALGMVLKNPEAGNLDMGMLALGLAILVYYVYQYSDKWQRTKN